MVASVIINTTIIVKFLLLMSFCFLSFTSVVSIENSTTKDYQHILSVFWFVLFCFVIPRVGGYIIMKHLQDGVLDR